MSTSPVETGKQKEFSSLLNKLPLFKETEIYPTERSGAIVALKNIQERFGETGPVSEKKSRLMACIICSEQGTTLKTCKVANQILAMMCDPGNTTLKEAFVDQIIEKQKQLIKEEAVEKTIEEKSVDSSPTEEPTHAVFGQLFNVFHTKCTKLNESMKKPLIPVNEYDFHSGIHTNNKRVAMSYLHAIAAAEIGLKIVLKLKSPAFNVLKNQLFQTVKVLSAASRQLNKIHDQFNEVVNLWMNLSRKADKKELFVNLTDMHKVYDNCKVCEEQFEKVRKESLTSFDCIKLENQLKFQKNVYDVYESLHPDEDFL